MYRLILFFFALPLACPFLMAQSIQPWVVNSAGGILQNTTMAVEWSLGEPAITTISTEEFLVTQGFLQPHFDTIVLVMDLPERWEVRVYPNPAESYLIFETAATDVSNLVLSDVAGRQVFETPFQPKLDIHALPSGVFFISLFDQRGRLLNTFKIIKN